jgi:dephospho-CoA kinase
MAKLLGITGGIGSGKTTVCSIFALLGIPIFEADREAKKLMHHHSGIKQKLIDWYGSDIYSKNECLDRKKLAAIIFNDNLQLQKVNELVHPVVRAEFWEWMKNQTAPYLIYEAAILFESGFDTMMDYTLLVSAPVKMRIKRVSSRDGISEEKVKERMVRQWSDEKKRKLSTFEIKNDSTVLILPQILKIDKQIKEYGKIW